MTTLLCCCGYVINDNTDFLPYKARFISDEDWDGEPIDLARSIYECEECGRLLVQSRPHENHYLSYAPEFPGRGIFSSKGVDVADAPMVPAIPLFEEVARFLASGPTPEQIIDFHLTAEANQRAEFLLDGNREGTLTENERAELDSIVALEHVMLLVKAEARRLLRERNG